VTRRVDRITFVEIKSGTSSPSPMQKSIERAIREGRVAAEVWRFGHRSLPIQQQLVGPTMRELPPGKRTR